MLLESGMQLQTVSMSIHQTEGVCDGMALRPGQWLKLKAKLSWIRMKVSLHCMLSHEGRRMKILLSTMDNAVWRKLCPQISNRGIHLLKWENSWTSLICCRSHSFREATNKKECHGQALCWKWSAITLSPNPTRTWDPEAWPSYVLSHFHPHPQDWLCWGDAAGILGVFCYNWPHMQADYLCMHCSSQKLEFN